MKLKKNHRTVPVRSDPRPVPDRLRRSSSVASDNAQASDSNSGDAVTVKLA